MRQSLPVASVLYHGWTAAAAPSATFSIVTKTLWTNPGVIGSVLNAQLKAHDLIVPTAHHPSPGIGGFCMNGGFGWNSRLWGNGARQVIAIAVANSKGELLRADANQNSDFWWAARGAGVGFSGGSRC